MKKRNLPCQRSRTPKQMQENTFFARAASVNNAEKEVIDYKEVEERKAVELEHIGHGGGIVIA